MSPGLWTQNYYGTGPSVGDITPHNAHSRYARIPEMHNVQAFLVRDYLD